MTATLAPSACVGRGDAARWLQRYGVYVAVLVLVVFNLVFTPNFLSASNLRTGHRPASAMSAPVTASAQSWTRSSRW